MQQNITSRKEEKKFILIDHQVFDELNLKIERLISLIENHKIQDKPTGWISEKEAQNFLGKKTTKMWQLRKEGAIKYSRIGNKNFYQTESLVELVKNNQVK